MKALTDNLLYSTSLADTTMTVDMLAEKVSDNATAFMQIRSSYRPATTAGWPATMSCTTGSAGVDARAGEALRVRGPGKGHRSVADADGRPCR
jgi:hypothetical protein